jgi:hypothetical protein
MHSEHGFSPNAFQRSSMGMGVAALLATAAVIMAPTKASAFDIGGLMRVAIAHYGGGYRTSGGHRLHEASRHAHHSADDDNDADTAPSSTNTPPSNQDATLPPRRFSPDGERTQPVGPTRVVSTGKSYAEEPIYAPLR